MSIPEQHKDVQTVFLAVYKNFMEAIDAVDNGEHIYLIDDPVRHCQSSTRKCSENI